MIARHGKFAVGERETPTCRPLPFRGSPRNVMLHPSPQPVGSAPQSALAPRLLMWLVTCLLPTIPCAAIEIRATDPPLRPIHNAGAYGMALNGVRTQVIERVGPIGRTEGDGTDVSETVSLKERTGALVIDFEFYNIGDQIQVFDRGTLIADTGFREGGDRLIVRYDPKAVESLEIVVNRGRAPDRGTLWSYGFQEVRVRECLFFRHSTDETGVELWMTDGTEQGTGIAIDFRPGPAHSAPEPLATVRGRVILTATTFEDQTLTGFRNLYAFDPEDGSMTLLKDFNNTLGYARNFFDLGGRLLFECQSDASGALSIWWVTDGTPAGTHPLVPAATAGDSRGELYALTGSASHYAPLHGQLQPVVKDGCLYFYSDNGKTESMDEYRYEFWRSDGTAAGTRKLHTYPSGNSYSWNNGTICAFGDFVYFVGEDANGLELWRCRTSDGQCQRFIDLCPGSQDSFVSEMEAIGDRLVFSAEHPDPNGRKVWSTDGTVQGTRVIAPVEIWNPDFMRRLNGRKLFIGSEFLSNVDKLWVSDGTEAGTHVLSDLDREGGISSFRILCDIPSANPGTEDEAIVFSIAGENSLEEFWITNGTAEGTFRLDEMIPNLPVQKVSSIRRRVLGNCVARNGIHYLSLNLIGMTADGSRSTQLVAFDAAARTAYAIATSEVVEREELGLPIDWQLTFSDLVSLNNSLVFCVNEGVGTHRIRRLGAIPEKPFFRRKLELVPDASGGGRIVADFGGLPEPVLTWQVSSDGGATWRAHAGSASASIDADGMLGFPDLAVVSGLRFRAVLNASDDQDPAQDVVSEPFAIEYTSLGVAADAPNLVWTTGGDAPWINATGEYDSFRGASAAQSGVIESGQVSWIETTVNGPSHLAFRWALRAGDDEDLLTLEIDGTPAIDPLKGNGWDLMPAIVPIPPGEHRVRWTLARHGASSGEYINGWLDAVAMHRGTLEEAADFAGPLTPGGSGICFAQSEVTHDGEDSVQLGFTQPDDLTSLNTRLSGPGTLSFWWRVSSEPYFDRLRVFINGTLGVPSISGESGWRFVSVELPAGEHAVSWVYQKDEEYEEGQDCGWIDQIRFVSAAIPAGGYNDWLARFGINDPDPLANPAGDGVANLVKYGLVIDPGTNAFELMPRAIRSNGRLGIVFRRDPARRDVTLVVESLDTPGGIWSEVASSTAGAAFTGIATVTEQSLGDGLREVTALAPASARASGFMRVRVVLAN